MQKQTKVQFERFHNFKDRNAWMRKMKVSYRLISRQNTWGDWVAEWNIHSSSLPEKIKIMREIKDLEKMRIEYLQKELAIEMIR